MSLILDGSGTITGATTLASTASININGTVGATTPAAVAATTLSATGITTVAAGSAALPAIVSTTGTADTGIWFPAADTVAASTGGTERLRINSSGTLLVGQTTNPATSTIVVTVATGSGNGVNAQITSNTGTSYPWSNYNASGAYVGGITCTSTGTLFPTSSDYRLKENVQPMVGALAAVAALKPCTYTWKLNGSNGQGFIAHELQAVVPDCVVGEKDAVNADGSIKPQGIDTSFLVATLTAAIQELKAIIDTQAAQITALNAKVGIYP